MHRFELWAPLAQRVDLVLGGDGEVSVPMHADGDGWWSRVADAAGPGTDYAYSLDGGDPLPDPRSLWQPHGVHGPSRVFEPSAFDWDDGQWPGPRQGEGAPGAIFYELHVGTFTSDGTLDAAVERLPHLVALGVDVVEVMPLGAFPGRWGWGYDGAHPGAVHAPYGGPEALQRFVAAAHRLGLGVCLDVVENHLGPSGNYLSSFGPYFTDRTETPWGAALNLDGPGSEPVRRWILDRAIRWFRDFHVDALRLDAVHEMHDRSSRPFLAELSDATAALSASLGRPLALVAESDLNDARMVEPTREGGLGLTAQWDDDVHHALHALLTGERQGYYVDFGSFEALAKVLTRVFLHDGGWSTFRNAEWGRPVDPVRHRGHQFVAYLQNHDQVGNRAQGDRLSPALAPGLQAAGAALVMCSAFTPMVFMGEEWGASTPWQYFTDFEEPELARAVRAGRREEFAEHGWDPGEVPDPQSASTRAASVLDWSEVAAPEHARMLEWYRALVALRRNSPELLDDNLCRIEAAYDADAGWFVLVRGSHRVVVNVASVRREVPLGGPVTEVLASWDLCTAHGQSVAVEPQSVAIVRVG
ncbi:MAG: malto-oligosyltrehalose trehalohydrolase [Actinomycetales bacterium]